MGSLFVKVINERHYNFQHFEFGEHTGYHVDVKDEEGKRWEFRMMREDDQWKMKGENLPEWVHDLEQQLGNAIDAHE